MAIITKDILFDNEHLNGAKWSFGVPLERTNPVPIDKWSTFKTYADAKEFVNRATGNIAYPGQIITIEGPDNVVDVYVVDRTATDCLKKLASGGSADEIAARVRELSSKLLSAGGIIDQLSGAHDQLSTALSTEIDSLSTSLSNDIDSLSTSLSNDIDNLSAALSNEISSLEGKLSSAWQFRGTVDAEAAEDNITKINANFADPQKGDVVIVNKKFVDKDGTESVAAIEYAYDGTTWQQLGDESSNVSKYQLKSAIEGLSTALSNEIDDLSIALSNKIDNLSNSLSNEIDNLSDAVSAEISSETKRASDAEAYLSTSIDSKIFAQLGDDADPVSVDTLTVHKITSDKYAELLASNKVVSSDIYVVESGEHNVYGEKITNVAEGTEATDAATYGQLTSAVDSLSDTVKLSVAELEKKIDDTVKGGVEALSTELLTPITGKIPVLDAKVDALDTKVDTLSTNLSNEIKALSGALSGDIDQLSTHVYTDLSIEMTATAGASDGVLSTFTFTQNGKTVGTINLPKDKVIESAKVVFGELSADGTFTPDDAGSATKSDKSKFYLEVVVANQTKKLYIPVPELADTYVGHDGTTVKVEISSDTDGARCIKAEVKDESITMAKLSGTFTFDCGGALA